MTSVVLNGVTPPLSYLGVIRAEGPDAASFLHGQLTQDFALLGSSEARLAALCTAKGRMIASFIGIKPKPETILLVCSKDILAATLKRLSMFVMRAKAKLTDASDQFTVYGLAGTAIVENGGDLSAAPGQRAALNDGNREASMVSLYPSDGVPRALWIAPADSAAPTGTPLDLGLWQWSEVRSGIVTLTTPVVEAFVPQMLNYESASRCAMARSSSRRWAPVVLAPRVRQARFCCGNLCLGTIDLGGIRRRVDRHQRVTAFDERAFAKVHRLHGPGHT